MKIHTRKPDIHTNLLCTNLHKQFFFAVVVDAPKSVGVLVVQR